MSKVEEMVKCDAAAHMALKNLISIIEWEKKQTNPEKQCIYIDRIII